MLAEDAPRPNVLVVVIDSLRADMLAPEIMPHLSEFARGARTFRDHVSSGNATRFGLFGLIYGLHGSYWTPMCDEHRSPVLVDALLARGYEVRVLTSASMTFPEFRSNAWVRVEDTVEDRLPSTRPGGRDDGTVERFEQWLGERDASRPFFAFLLLDAPHQAYAFPEDCAVFRPYTDEIAYSQIDSDATPEERAALFNRYKNAVHYADQCTGRILDALGQRGLAQDTLIAVTGDHGEEFCESGVWGHTSNFTRAQTHVPFVLAGPHIPPGEETRPTSRHRPRPDAARAPGRGPGPAPAVGPGREPAGPRPEPRARRLGLGHAGPRHGRRDPLGPDGGLRRHRDRRVRPALAAALRRRRDPRT